MLNDAMKDNPELRSVSERFFQQVSQRIKAFLVVTLFSLVVFLLLCLFPGQSVSSVAVLHQQSQLQDQLQPQLWFSQVRSLTL